MATLPDTEASPSAPRVSWPAAAVAKQRLAGLNKKFNEKLGGDVIRVGITVTVDAGVEMVQPTVRRNLMVMLDCPTCTPRLVTQGDEYWYRDDTAEDIINSIVHTDSSGGNVAQALMRCDGSGQAVMPVVYIVLEPICDEKGGHDTVAGKPMTRCHILFRHDIIDGWRCLRYITPLFFKDVVLTFEKMRRAHENRQRPSLCWRMLHYSVSMCCTVAHMPFAASKLMRIATSPGPGHISSCQDFYLHCEISLRQMKDLAKKENTGSVSSTIVACIAAAYFQADQTRTQMVVAQNRVSDMDATFGNHGCFKMATIYRQREGRASGHIVKDGTLHGLAKGLSSKGQALTDLVIMATTSRFCQGSGCSALSDKVEDWHSKLDFLVSNIPSIDKSSPEIVDIQVCREVPSGWSPPIIYIISSGDRLFCDFYCGMPPQFNSDVFCAGFATITNASNVHRTLPACHGGVGESEQVRSGPAMGALGLDA